MAADRGRSVPVGLNVWSRLVERTFTYLDQTAASFGSLWFPDQVTEALRAIVAQGAHQLMVNFGDVPRPDGTLLFAEKVLPQL